MENYTLPIIWAIIIFPFVAALFTVPYVLIQYHKYGSVPMLRVCVVYSFILYLIAAYFLVILPLPSIETVANLKGPVVQLIPFQFVHDFLSQTSLVITNPNTYLKALTEPYFYQIFYNILLLLPFGIFLRYYFKCSFKKTVLLSFLLSLFFELTQLSGLYGIYPRGYRLFDIDDLMINTLGGILGYYVSFIVLKILPTREKIDHYALEIGKRVTVWKRIVNLLLDGFLIIMIQGILYLFLFHIEFFHNKITIPFLSFFSYYFLIPLWKRGKTLGKSFLNMQLVTLDNKTPKWYQYIVRYFLLYFVVFSLPFYGLCFLELLKLLHLENNLYIYLSLGGLVIIAILILTYYIFTFFQMLKGNLLFYEKISKTKNQSTIQVSEEMKDPTENINKDIRTIWYLFLWHNILKSELSESKIHRELIKEKVINYGIHCNQLNSCKFLSIVLDACNDNEDNHEKW